MKKYNNKDYDIYYYPLDKFKTIDVKLVFARNVTNKDLMYLNVLLGVLTYSSKKYPTNRKLMIELEELYDLYLSSGVTRCANRLLAMFDLSFINPIYTDKKYFKLSIDFLSEILLNPLVNNKAFDKKVLSLIIDQLKNDVMYSYHHPQGRVNEELYKGLDANIGITLYQNMDILDTINENNLYEYYCEFLNNSEIKLFVTGNIDDNMLKVLSSIPIVSKKIVFNDNKIVNTSDKNINYIKGNYNQNKLAYLFRYNDVSFYEYYYVSSVFNCIYGGLQDSLLMTNVREKDSLVYYIDAYLRKVDQVIMLNAGFSKENTELVLKGIKDNLELIKKGDFSLDLINKAKENITVDLTDTERSPSYIINYMIGRIYVLDNSNKEKLKEYLKVTKEDIIAFAKKLDICRIMVLEGSYEEKA